MSLSNIPSDIVDALCPPVVFFGIGRPHYGVLPTELVITKTSPLTVAVISQKEGKCVRIVLTNEEARRMAEAILREVRA